MGKGMCEGEGVWCVLWWHRLRGERRSCWCEESACCSLLPCKRGGVRQDEEEL